MKLYKRLLSICAVLFFLSNNLFAQSEKINKIDSLMKAYYEKGVFNGNILVSDHKKIIYNTSFGYVDATKIQHLTTDYRFNIGSITKEFSAVALMQLYEKGKLNLDDKVSKFIPELPKWANQVSIKNLLQYTSGLPNVNFKNIKNDTDILNDLMQVKSLDFEAGTNYDYNMNNVFLRQFVVERLTGMNYKDYVENFIFKPCKMTFANITPLVNESKIARGFNNQLIADKPDLPLTGGTYLTTIDLLKWTDCLYKNKLINKKSTYKIAETFPLPETQSSLGETEYKKGKLIKHLHDGRYGNYEDILVSNLEEKYTIILLSNNYNGKISEISEAISKILTDKN